MKKMLLILILMIVLVGCDSKSKLESEMKNATNIYYDEYIKNKIEGLDTLEITLGDLRNLMNDKIDLSSLSKCDDDTKIEATIKNNELADYKITLNCK